MKTIINVAMCFLSSAVLLLLSILLNYIAQSDMRLYMSLGYERHEAMILSMYDVMAIPIVLLFASGLCCVCLSVVLTVRAIRNR